MRLDEPNGGGVIIGANRGSQLLSDSVGSDTLLQLSPMRKTVLASNHILSVAQVKRACGNASIVRIGKPRMAAADTVERVGMAVTPQVEELAGFAPRNIKVRTIR